MSGKYFNEEHPPFLPSPNKKLISFILSVFHLDISGKDFRLEHPKNIPEIFLILPVSHKEISGKDNKDEQA